MVCFVMQEVLKWKVYLFYSVTFAELYWILSDPHNTNHGIKTFIAMCALWFDYLTVDMKPAGVREQQVNDYSSVYIYTAYMKL